MLLVERLIKQLEKLVKVKLVLEEFGYSSRPSAQVKVGRPLTIG